MKLSKFIIVFFLMVPFSVNAGFHLEPYLGRSLSGDWDSGTSDDASMGETGIKLGYQAPSGFQVGGDLQVGVGEYKNIVNAGTNSDAAQVSMGAYLGYQTSMGLRAYVHYFFSSALVIDDVLADLELKGKGFKFGVGYSLLSWLAVNAEYHMMTYDEYKDITTSNYATLDPKLKNNFFMIGVSFPFNIGGNSR